MSKIIIEGILLVNISCFYSYMKKKINKGILITLIVLPFVVVLSWLLYTKKISFNLLSKASDTPDYIVCLKSDQDPSCTVLYSGAEGLYKLFHDSNINLDANNDGKVYIKILAGNYTLTTNSLTSVSDQDREWIKLSGIKKSVTIEGTGDVTLDGSAYVGGVYAQNTAAIFVKNITFSNLLTSTTYCKLLTDSCPVGKAFVLDGSKVTLNATKVNTAANGSAILYNTSTLEVLAQSVLSNNGGIGITVKDKSTLTIQNKSTVTSSGLNAISLSSSAILTTSSSTSVGNNEISMTKTVSGNSGYTILAQDNSSIKLSMTNVKSYSGGILASGTASISLADCAFTSSRAKLDTLLSLTGTSKLTAMTKTSIKGGLYGILLNGAVEITSIASSDISGNTNGIYVIGGTTTDTKSQVKNIGSSTFTGNSYGIYLKNFVSLNITKGTIFDSNTTAGICEYNADAGERSIIVTAAEFKNNATGITSYLKATASKPNLNVYDSKFDITTTGSQTGIYVTGKSGLYVSGTTFNKEKYGIRLNSGGVAYVLNSVFSNNINGVEADVSGSMFVYRNVFSKNTTNGMILATSIAADIRNNVFDGNNTAFYFTGSNASYKSIFANNVIANSTVAGLVLSANTDVLSDYNNIYYQNVSHVKAAGTKLQSVSGYNIYYPYTSTLFKNFTPQVTSYKTNPLLDVTTWKPLNSSSPEINSGNPATGYNDKDGSRNDIGITGGPQGTTETIVNPGTVSALWNFDQTKDASCSDGKDVCNSAVKADGKIGDYNGTVKGIAPIVTSINNNGRDFDGKTGTYVDVGDKNDFETQSFTIIAVVRKEGSGKSFNNNYMILTKGCSSFEGFCFGLTGSSPVLTMRINDTGTDGKQYLNGKTVITDNQWYHVAVVVNGAAKTISLYVNGKLDASGSFTEAIYYSGASVKIGNGNDKNDLGFDGTIDYISFDGSVASASTILSSYQSLIGTVSSTCGNGKIDANSAEFCDDGNTTNGDGCSSVCKYEADLNKDGKVTITGDYAPLYSAIKKYLLDQTAPDPAFDLNKDGKATINGDYILFLKYYKYYLKSLL